MISLGAPILVLLALVAIPLGIVALIYLIIPVFKGVAWLVRQVLRFVIGEISDVLRLIGAIVTGIVLVPLVIGNIVIGRWSASAHFGRAIRSECHTGAMAVYRMLIGHPARLLCLTPLVDGIERRIPEAVAAAPGADRPRGREGQFPGYTIVGSLAGGGSGGRLYVAEPSTEKAAALSRQGMNGVERVVIKSFSLRDGSTLPQIVRENRALDAAKRLGLIIEHELTQERFHYVMKYVPGDSLSLVTQRMHAASGDGGLDGATLARALEYSCDLLRTLCHYHSGGLWHKDVKPDNIIVSDGQAHLVDFGLVTPLRSAMTLTTHGTEYFRDPEMVRMALRGVKVHQVDGAKFDVYAAGAVIFSMIENSFPAHGGLSQITRRCPETVRWIVRRAMTDYDKRYANAGAMLADLEVVAAARDPYALRPADLPSVGETGGEESAAAAGAAAGGRGADGAEPDWVFARGARSPRPPAEPAPARAGRTPKVKVTSWWSGRYQVEPGDAGVKAPGPIGAAFGAMGAAAAAVPHERRRTPSASAAEQVRSARRRAAEARKRAQSRMRSRRGVPDDVAGINTGVGVALAAFMALMACVGLAVYLINSSKATRAMATAVQTPVVSVGDGTISVRTSTASVVRVGEPATGAARVATTVRGAAPAWSAKPKGRMLVLRDASTLSPEMAEATKRQFKDLASAGFELIGNVPGNEEIESEEREAQDAMIADVRNAVRLLPFQSAEARSVIRGWLDASPDVDLLLWVARGDDPAEASWWIVGPSVIEKGVLSAAADAIQAKPARTAGR
ncbi:MAG: hypothetical protein KF745_01765 [Phycisphaeraceae bacterium]|nr:hypothetical protein [Phycisphaeraceae bacterium]